MGNLEISAEDIARWEQIRSNPSGWREYDQARELFIEQLLGGSNHFLMHVDPHSFRAQKSAEEQVAILKKHGYGPFLDPAFTPREIHELLLEDIEPDSNGFLTFEPRRLYLCFTKESIAVPADQFYRMRSYFILEDTEEQTLLRAHFTAPTFQSNSRGKQTCEVMYEADSPFRVKLERLAFVVAVFQTTGPSQETPQTFGVQQGQRPVLGNSYL